jgi:hypothetical protein
MGEPQKDATHSANFGLGLQRRCKEVGIDCILAYPGVDAPRFRKPEEFLIKKLR